jgi:hypothetical protein
MPAENERKIGPAKETAEQARDLNAGANLLEMNATDFDIPIPAPKALTASATKCC